MRVSLFRPSAGCGTLIGQNGMTFAGCLSTTRTPRTGVCNRAFEQAFIQRWGGANYDARVMRWTERDGYAVNPNRRYELHFTAELLHGRECMVTVWGATLVLDPPHPSAVWISGLGAHNAPPDGGPRRHAPLEPPPYRSAVQPINSADSWKCPPHAGNRGLSSPTPR